jgi:hypothetical protein
MKKEFIRKLQRASSHSYVLTIPKELIASFKWRERQKLVLKSTKKGEIKIVDWKPKKKK